MPRATDQLDRLSYSNLHHSSDFLNKRKTEGRNHLLRATFLQEYQPSLAVSSAEIITREIDDIASYNCQSRKFVAEIRRKLYFLLAYSGEDAKDSFNHPSSRKLKSLLKRYINLEYDVLYKSKYTPDDEEFVESRVFSTVMDFLCSVYYRGDYDIDKQRKHLFKEACKIFIHFVDTGDKKKFPTKVLWKMMRCFGLDENTFDKSNPFWQHITDFLKNSLIERDSAYCSEDDAEDLTVETSKTGRLETIPNNLSQEKLPTKSVTNNFTARIASNSNAISLYCPNVAQNHVFVPNNLAKARLRSKSKQRDKSNRAYTLYTTVSVSDEEIEDVPTDFQMVNKKINKRFHKDNSDMDSKFNSNHREEVPKSNFRDGHNEVIKELPMPEGVASATEVLQYNQDTNHSLTSLDNMKALGNCVDSSLTIIGQSVTLTSVIAKGYSISSVHDANPKSDQLSNEKHVYDSNADDIKQNQINFPIQGVGIYCMNESAGIYCMNMGLPVSTAAIVEQKNVEDNKDDSQLTNSNLRSWNKQTPLNFQEIDEEPNQSLTKNLCFSMQSPERENAVPKVIVQKLSEFYDFSLNNSHSLSSEPEYSEDQKLSKDDICTEEELHEKNPIVGGQEKQSTMEDFVNTGNANVGNQFLFDNDTLNKLYEEVADSLTEKSKSDQETTSKSVQSQKRVDKLSLSNESNKKKQKRGHV